MLRCRQVVELVGTDAVSRASVGVRLQVRTHLLMCRHCGAYVRSIRQIAATARRLMSEAPTSATRDAAREDVLLQAIRRAIDIAGETRDAPSP
ncbi:MAG: hypothetical protein ABI910_17215 [Gemmatimonadota bacterium]